MWIQIIRDSFRESTSNRIQQEEQRAHPAWQGFVKSFYQQKARLSQRLDIVLILRQPECQCVYMWRSYKR